jgi:glycosyltransferase involved in cell wall biosynthesis
MRVLLVHNFYQIPGGEDAIVREELSLLQQNGIEARLFSVSNMDISGPFGSLRTALSVVYSPAGRRAMAKELVRFAPDVVHIHNFFPLLSPSILDACRSAGVPCVLTLHNFRILCPTAFFHSDEKLRRRSLHGSTWWTVPRKAYRNSAAGTLALAAMIEFHKRAGTWKRKVDRFIALTEYARQTFIAGGLPADRIVVKPNCVAPPARFSSARRCGALFVGRLDEQKGVRTLLEAWKNLDCPLTIIGDGPLSESVQAVASDRIVWLGRQPWEVVQREMQSAQFLVLPSRGLEMFPVTVVEAFSCQLPVICSDLPSLAELIEPGVTGLDFPAGDATALAACVRRATADPAMLAGMGQRAGEIYNQRYTPEANYRWLAAVYQSLLAPAPGAGLQTSTRTQGHLPKTSPRSAIP